MHEWAYLMAETPTLQELGGGNSPIPTSQPIAAMNFRQLPQIEYPDLHRSGPQAVFHAGKQETLGKEGSAIGSSRAAPRGVLALS
jgi:hypothetical protein